MMIWKQIPNFSRYEISEYGDVRRGLRRLNGFIDMDGYLKYALYNDDDLKQSVYAHRLIATSFISPAPTPQHEIAHNNGSRLYNHPSNLRWATRRENDHDTVLHGTNRIGVRNGRSKIIDEDVLHIRTTYRMIKNREINMKVSELAAQYGLHHATLLRVAKGKSWSHVKEGMN